MSDYNIPTGGVSVLDAPAPVVQNNGVSFKLDVKKFRRGAMVDQPFWGLPEVTAENLEQYIQFRGLEEVLDVLNSRENLNAQTALMFYSDATDATGTDGKVLRTLNDIKFKELAKAIETNTCRGETIKALQAKIDELTKELMELATNFDATNPDVHQVTKMKSLGLRLKNYQEQKEARSRKKSPADED